MRLSGALCVAVALVAACGGDDDDDMMGSDAGPGDGSGDVTPEACESVAPTACDDPDSKFADVQPIIEERCVPCHDGTGDEWPLTTWRHTADWAMEIRGVMLDCSMPPDDSDVRMTQAERDAILMWLRCGFEP